LRLAQYFGKFLEYKLLTAEPKSELGQRVSLLSKGIGLHRKAFRLGNWHRPLTPRSHGRVAGILSRMAGSRPR
jgi:hypothetical protein